MMEIEQLRSRLSIGIGGFCILIISILTTWGDSEDEFQAYSFEMAWWILVVILVFHLFGEAAISLVALIPKKEKDK